MKNASGSVNFRFSRRNLFGFGAAAGLVTALGACTTPEKGSTPLASAEGVITAGISYERGSNGYDPMTTSAALTIAANWHIFEGLTEIDPVTRAVYAALGAELPKKIDDTTYEVKLRDGAVFHDGSKVSVDDVIFSFTRVLDPASKSFYTPFLFFLDKVEKKDDTTVTIKAKFPYSLIAERLSPVKIVPKAVVEKDPQAFDQLPVGTGPYKMTDAGAGSQKLVFEAFGGYTGSRKAKAKSMVWQIIPDDSTRTNALQSGTVQAIDAVPATNLATLANSKKVSALQGFSLLFAMFNCGFGPMADVRNRRAVMYALDYENITKNGMNDLATAATSFVQQEHPAYKAAKVSYLGKTDEAKKLLAETGLKKVRVLATDHGWFSAVRPIIKESLAAAGLEVIYEEKKSTEAYGVITGEGKNEAFDVFIAPGDPSVFGSDVDLALRWWFAGDLWTQDRMRWKGQESYNTVQTLLGAAARVTGEEQKAKWHEIFDILSENIPLYPIFHRKTPTAWDDKTIPDFKPISMTGFSFLDVASTKK